MGHHCCSKQKVKRGLWSPEEDEKLLKFITTHGHGCWSSVPKLAGLQRCGKSCRLRWINYLRPDLKKGSFSAHEERIIIDVHRILGNRWAQIAKHLPGRTDNEVKNFWNSCIKKKLIAQGLDPKTHNLMPSSNSRPSNNNVNVSNLSQFLQTHFPHTTTPFTISSNIKSFDTTTKSNSMTDQNAIPPPFVTLSTPSASILPLHESNNMPTFQYQDPNVLMSFKDQLDPHESLMDYTNICSSSSMENANNFNHSDFVDESCMWGGSCHDIDPLEDTKQNGEELQQQFQRHGQSSNAMNGEGINKGVVEMEMSYDSSTFDLELMDSALLPCGMFSENTMEQLQWEC